MLSKLVWTLISIFLISIIFSFIIIFFDLLSSNFKKVEEAITYKAKNIKTISLNKNKLKIMTWNIKFGAGRIDVFFDCHGNREIIKEDEVIANLKAISNKIKEIDPDIIFLQEVDIKSKRTSNVDQAQFILNNTDLNYGYYASQWKSLFIPKNNIGKINTGNLILSKYPLKEAKRYSLVPIKSQNLIMQYFYLKRNFLVANLELNNHKIILITTHLSAFAQDETKSRQIKQVENFTNGLKQDKINFILAGDFNIIPPGSTKVNNFPDSVCKGSFEADDFTEQVEWLSSIYNNQNSAIKLSDYQKNNEKYFTHTTDKNGFWNRKLDYIFSNGNLENGEVLQKDTMKLSDHAPIIVDYILE
jgi:endonuclease/exonuclease/phosphatase family metal-dependent hydrolase